MQLTRYLRLVTDGIRTSFFSWTTFRTTPSVPLKRRSPEWITRRQLHRGKFPRKSATRLRIRLVIQSTDSQLCRPPVSGILHVFPTRSDRIFVIFLSLSFFLSTKPLVVTFFSRGNVKYRKRKILLIYNRVFFQTGFIKFGGVHNLRRLYMSENSTMTRRRVCCIYAHEYVTVSF